MFNSTDDGASWVPLDFVQVPGAFHFFPTLAADETGEVGLSFQTIDAGGTVAHTWFAASTGFPILLAGPYTPGTPRALGDYAGMAVIPPRGIGSRGETFLPAWTETAGGVSVVDPALVRVLP